jgi:hypothetical protein
MARTASICRSVMDRMKPKHTIVTFRFTPFIFFSPSNFLSKRPMLAVLPRVVANVRSISIFLDSRSEVPAARLTFCRCWRSFLATRDFLSSRAAFAGSKPTSAFALTSVSHCVSVSLFLASRPQRLTQSCFSSSQIFRSRLTFWIPFADAKRSHFV